MKKYILYKILISLTLVFNTGCNISEVMYDCPGGLAISFRYVLNSENVDKFNDRVGQITIFVFESEDQFIKEITTTVEDINATNNTIVFDMPEGTYSIVAVGGYLKDYEIGVESGNSKNSIFTRGLIYGETKLSDFRIRAEAIASAGGVIDHKFDDLFMGLHENIVVSQAEITTANIDLTLNGKTINVSFNGLDSPYYIPILKCGNGVYNAENSISNNVQLLWYPFENAKANNYTFSNLRLVQDNPMYLTIIDSQGNDLVPNDRYNILEYIMASSTQYQTQNGLDRQEIYEDINLNFDNNKLVQVTIGKWSIEIVQPEI